jgi:glycosyltransferase involved in cell wall biosynthesis
MIASQLAYRLARAGHEVIIYAKKVQAQPNVERHAEGILYRRISIGPEDLLMKPVKLLDRLGLVRNPKRPLFASRLYYPGYALQTAWDLKQRQPDIIHIYNFSQYVPLIRAFNPKAKIVLHMECEWLSQLDRAVVEGRLHEVDLIIGCSGYITERIRDKFPQFSDRCITIYNGVDANQFVREVELDGVKKSKAERLLFVGRISPEKGVHILLEAFQRVVQCVPHVGLEVVGPPGAANFEFIVPLADDEKVSELAQFYSRKSKKADYISRLQNQLDPKYVDQVVFTGSIPHSHLMNHYRDADVFLFPSVWHEPFGIPLVEAMACQVPVIATRSGGMTEIVEEGKTGLLVERGNAADLAEGILRLLKDEDLRISMGEAGRERVLGHFTWDRIAESLLNEYENLQAAVEN